MSKQMKTVDVKEKARQRELRVLAQWEKEDTFRQSIANRQGSPRFVFYEGPPTANGKPHIGHVLGRVIKDFIGRYKTMSGYQVIRKAGWDTHGLPVELGVQKQLGISGKQEIETYGVARFVEDCKASVFEYERQWRELTEAIAYWTDLDHPYVTLDNDYIESVWHLLSTIHKKGLLYKGHRVSPYCPCCQTTLSSHEVAQGYEDVKDLSATVKFPSKENGLVFLAWTTTPWTLPGNIALAVNKDMEYALARQQGETYVVALNLVERVLKADYEVLSVKKGAELVGLTYEPPFDSIKGANGFRVVDADYVSDTSGTGIVHTAPAHGEEDYRTVQKHGLDFHNVVDTAGRYTAQVQEFQGRFVKDCDVDVVRYLAEKGLLYAKERYEHSYPFCWRCKSPLLYYATDSWFIRTTAVKEQLIENNSRIEWYPGHLKEGRFGRFLEELVDWNISRNRYWGTPLNVWVCPDCGGERAPGSRQELQDWAAGPVAEVLELHKPYVDGIKLRCSCGGLMERTSEVIDVWFDSGSMPFAQYHHPFGDGETFREQYPADMICEGIDQTRGWFFSLLAISTLYNGQAPYKAVISIGHVLDENGLKMSKSKGNVIDPWDIIEEYGADAFRWAFLSDSAPWSSKRFSRQIVADAKSKVVDTIQNVHAFYALYASIDGYRPEAHPVKTPQHDLDRWILSRLNTLLLQVEKGLEANDFLNPARLIEAFVDELSNWYLRRSRERFWAEGLPEDKLEAYQTLRQVLLTLARMTAPYMPFLAEELYGNLGGEGSVHLADYPRGDAALSDSGLEAQMETVRQVVELARNIRNETGLKTRQPLSRLLLVMEQPLSVERFGSIIQEEINVKDIQVLEEDADMVDLSFKLNLKLAGRTYGPLVGPIQQALKGLAGEAARQAWKDGYIEVVLEEKAVRISMEELLVEKKAKDGLASASGYGITAALDTALTAELTEEGMVREVVRIIQDYRKKLELPIDKRVLLVLDAGPELALALDHFEGVLRENVLLSGIRYAREDGMEEFTVEANTLQIKLE